MVVSQIHSGEKLFFSLFWLFLLIFLILPIGCGGDGGNGSKSTKKDIDIGKVEPLDSTKVIKNPQTGLRVISDQILISFKDMVSEAEIKAKISSINGEIVGYIKDLNNYQVRINGNPALEQLNILVEQLENDPDVEAVSLNIVHSMDRIPDDPEWDDEWNETSPGGKNWGLEAIRAISAWDYNESMTTVRVGIVDGGFNINHLDLSISKDNATGSKSRYYAIESDDPNDSDGDGSPDYIDKNNHGTHVAGIIGALSDNREGITGIIWKRDIYLYRTDYQDFDIEHGITWCLEKGAKILNLSLGADVQALGRDPMDNGTSEIDTDDEKEYIEKPRKYWTSFMKKLIKKYDFLIVQSAGNDRIDAKWKGLFNSIDDDALRSKIITVGAIEMNQFGEPPYSLVYWSNYGSRVEVVAPGVDIYSTIAYKPYYESLSGTSMAAPHVAGVAGLLWAVNPNLTADRVKTIIIETANSRLITSNDNQYRILNAKDAVEKVVQKGNTKPIVSNVFISGQGIGEGGTGDITITYDLTDADEDVCDIVIVEYQGGSVGLTWTQASVSGKMTDIMPGSGKTIIWRSATDEFDRSANDYKIKITPRDGYDIGTAGISSSFSVNNISGIAVGQNAPTEAIKNHFVDCYKRNGGVGSLSHPTSKVYPWNGYWVQDFSDIDGIIFYNSSLDYAYFIQGAILKRYYDKFISLGQPIKERDVGDFSKPTGIKCIYQDFEKGAIELFGTGKSILILNLFFQKWAELGYAGHDLGYPIEDESEEGISSFGTRFKYQNFEGGALEYLISSNKVVEVHGAIFAKWKSLNYASSGLGLPTQDEKEAAKSPISGWTGRYSLFEGGAIDWIKEKDKTVVIGLNQPGAKAIAEKYGAEGGSGGGLGFPMSDDYSWNGGLRVDFENGYIHWTQSKGAVTDTEESSSPVGRNAPTEAIQNHFIDCYNRNGGKAALSDPTSDVYRWNGYWVQDFSGSKILYNSSLSYAYLLKGAILTKYSSKVSGLGAPTSEQGTGDPSKPSQQVTRCTYQNFEKGAIEVYQNGSLQGQALTVLNPFFQKWAELGYAKHDLGYPIEEALGDFTSYFGTKFKYQNFEGGALEYLINAGKVVEIQGAIFTKWKSLGYASSGLGLPTQDEKEAAKSPISGWTGRYSLFEGGAIDWIKEKDKTVVIGLNQPGAKAIAEKYGAEGGSGGGLGFPMSDDYSWNGGLRVDFEKGYIHWTQSKGAIRY